MTHDAALEIFRLQLVALTGLPDAQISKGPLDSTRRTAPWITLIPLSKIPQRQAAREGTALSQSYDRDILVTAYGTGAVDGLEGALAELPSDTPNATMALDQGVTLRQSPSARPSSFVPKVVRTAHEPRESATLRIGYVFTRVVAAPLEADSVTVDVIVDGGPTYEPAFVVGV